MRSLCVVVFWMVFALVAVLFVIRAKHPTSTGATPNGRSIGSQTFDFGQARADTKISHTFTVRNPFGHPLPIIKTISSCSCTVASTLPSAIPAGGAIDVEVTAALGRAYEQFAQQVSLHFEQLPPVILTVQGKVIRQFPPLISFERVRRADAAIQQFILRSAEQRPLRILDVRQSRPLVNVVHKQVAPDNNDLLCILTLRGDIPYGEFSDWLELITDDAIEPVKRIVLQGYVEDIMEFEPNVLNFGAVALGEKKTLVVAIRTPYGQSIQVQGVAVYPVELAPAVTVHTANRASTRPSVSEVTVQLDADALSGRIVKGEIAVQATIDGQHCTRRLELYAMRLSRALPLRSP